MTNSGYNTYIHGNVTNEIPCVAILTKQKCLFSKTKNRKVRQDLSGGWYRGRREDIRKWCRQDKSESTQGRYEDR
jgi:hypothetical protein